MDKPMRGLTPKQAFIKRCFDILFAALGLLFSFWIIAIAFFIALIDTGKNGFFMQSRVGQHGRLFLLIKIRTMKEKQGISTVVTTANDPRVTRIGRFFRKTKIDELPQLLNVLIGDMSFVGPRPDVPGFADRLEESDRIFLSVRPGITGPATLKYRNEELLLAKQPDPESYNRNVIFPDKVRINIEYIANWSLRGDLTYIWRTIVG